MRPPAITLPKGGGAIRGIGEKFAANPVTGTGSMTVPIATSPGRSGFGPQLSLSYDSGAGNGPFGFGWSLGLPPITRKTDKGLPQYRDAEESDVFILSGAEDLVPVCSNADGTRFERRRTHRQPGYTHPPLPPAHRRAVRPHRALDPRERRRRPLALDLQGQHPHALRQGRRTRASPTPPIPRRIFSWLICETRDDKGNAVLYEYKAEDGAGVDLAQAHERNRGDRDDPRRTANRYLKRIRYGNRAPLLDDAGHRPRLLTDAQIQNAGWMFEVVFDYGEHDADAPTAGRRRPVDLPRRPVLLLPRRLRGAHRPPLPARADVPSLPGRGGRRQRLPGPLDRLHLFARARPRPTRATRSTPSCAPSPRPATGGNDGGYLKRSLPPVEFEYTQPIVQDTVQDVDAASLENLPVGLDGAAYQWTDLHGEGIPGILTEQAGAWFYKRNLSPISRARRSNSRRWSASPPSPTSPWPAGRRSSWTSPATASPIWWCWTARCPASTSTTTTKAGSPSARSPSRLNRDMRDPNLRFVDLDGDGHADVLITEDDAFVWHPSLAEEGFGPARRVQQALDEEKGPRLVFADGTQSIYLADLSGDGLTDLVRIRNGEVCYWPNLGYGRFGAKVTMDNAPWFDDPDQFDQKRIRLADIDGSGTTDIIYLHRDGVRLYFNQSGNSWSAPQPLRVFPRVDDLVVHRRRRPARQRHRLPGLVVAAAGRRAAADALRRPDGRAEAAPARQDRQQPRRRNPRRVRAVDQVLPAGQARRQAVDHAAAVPGARGRAGRDLRPHQPQPLRHPLRLPPRLLRRRGARVPRLRHGRAVGHRGVRGAHRRRHAARRPPTSTPPRTCRRCSPRPGSTPASIWAATTSPTSSPACWMTRTRASTTASRG